MYRSLGDTIEVSVWNPTFGNSDYKILSDEIKLDGHIQIAEQVFQFKLFDNSFSEPVTRTKILRTPSVTVLLYHKESQKVVLVEQFRHACIDVADSPWLLEAVAGMIEPNETPEQTAIREAREEAGCEVTELVHIGNYLPTCGVSNEVTYTYCGFIKELPTTTIHGEMSESENTKVHILTYKEVEELITFNDSNRVLASNVFVTLQWFLLNFSELNS